MAGETTTIPPPASPKDYPPRPFTWRTVLGLIHGNRPADKTVQRLSLVGIALLLRQDSKDDARLLREAVVSQLAEVRAAVVEVKAATEETSAAVAGSTEELATFRGIVAGRSRCPEPKKCQPATSCPPCPEPSAGGRGYGERHR